MVWQLEGSSVALRDRSLFTGSGGGGHYFLGEGHYLLSSTLGRADFKKNSLREDYDFLRLKQGLNELYGIRDQRPKKGWDPGSQPRDPGSQPGDLGLAVFLLD